jgi:hypothetical protein
MPKIPLSEENEDSVNYPTGGTRKYTIKGEEYEEYDDRELPNVLDVNDLYVAEYGEPDDPESGHRLKEILMENTDYGYIARSRFLVKLLGDRFKGSTSNEAGWINEYWFGKKILPEVYGITGWEPSWEKYFNKKELEDPWDFRYPNISIDVKTQAIGDYPERKYICPESKLTTNKPNSTNFAIWWSECNTYDDVINNRESPLLKYKYYQSSISDWDKLIKYRGWYGERFYNPKRKYDKSWKESWNDTSKWVAQVRPPSSGDFQEGFSSDQLYFDKNILTNYKYNILSN